MNVQQLFAEYHDPLYRYLVRLTGDADAAADLAQDTFIKWVEHRPAGTQVKAWLFKVATNLARDDVRVRSRRLELLQEAPDCAPLGDRPLAPDDALEAGERRRMVRKALDSLSPKERTMLLMREEGFSHREIADAVGTTTKSVGTMLVRALRTLTAELAPDLETLP